MKRLFFLIFLIFQPLNAQQFPFVMELPIPSSSAYKKSLEEVNKNEILDLEQWKNKKFIKKNSKDEKKFIDFSKTEQILLVLLKAEKISSQLANLDASWQNDSKKALDANPSMIQISATKQDIEFYRSELNTFRKKFAIDYEKFAEINLKETNLSEKEIVFKINQIKEFHNKYKLVDRK